MTSASVISLAILKVNWDELKKDYLENFVPMVVECIRLSPDDFVSLPDLQSGLQQRFGLRIPLNVINALLRRAQKRGYIKSQNGVYTRVVDNLAKLNFHDVQQQVLRMHESVIGHLIKFCVERFGLSWKAEEAEKAFQSYIEEHQLRIISRTGFIPVLDRTEQALQSSRYIIGVFVQHLQETHSSDFDYFETIVKGNLLANAIFLTEPGKVDKKFRKTEVYFDTSFLVYALGYAGKAREDPCRELLTLLYENGAELRCFRHTLDETHGVLDACMYRMRQGQTQTAYGPSMEYFITMGFTDSDIELFAIYLERDLAALRISVVDKPPYTPEYMIAESALAELFRDNIQYHNPQALDRDVDSVSAIIRLRCGQEFYMVEECRAVFITTNDALVRQTRKFFYKESSIGTIPPCLPDYTITNLLWLKQPQQAPDLPRKRIIADYYAATQPSERLWRQYLIEIDKQKQNQKLTPNDYYELRYSLEAKYALMDLTLGEESAFSQGTIPEILNLIHSKLRADDQKRLSNETEKRIAAERESELAKAKDRERLSRISARAQSYAAMTARAVEYCLLLLLVFGVASTFPWNFPAFDKMPLNYLLAFIQIAILVFSVANLMYGTTLISLVRKLEMRLSKWIEQRLKSFAEL